MGAPRTPKNPVTGVTAQQEAWCFHTIRLGDLNHAYRLAYNAKAMGAHAVRTEASRMLDNPAIALRLQHYQALAEKKLEVTVERIAAELARIGFADPADLCDDDGNFLPLHLIPENVRRAVQSVKVIEKAGAMKIDAGGAGPAVEHVPERTKEIRFWNKHEALVTMAKWKRMLVDRIETGKPGEFEAKSTDQLDQEAKDILAEAIKGGFVKALPRKQA